MISIGIDQGGFGLQAVIMAGGKGTRLFTITNDEIPKSMVCIDSKPILEHQIERLKENSITDIIIIIGHLGQSIINYFGYGEGFGVTIRYINEEKPLGSAGSLYFLKDIIMNDFLLIYGDLIFDIDIMRMYEYHKEKQSVATLFVHPNSHPFDSDLVVISNAGKIINFDSKNNIRNYYYDNYVNAGLYIFSKEILAYIKEPIKTDLEKDVLFNLCGYNGEVYAYISTEYVKDVGTTERIEKTKYDIERGIVSNKNLSKPQKCVFLDRDGVINKHIGLLYEIDQLVLEKTVIEALGKLNSSDYLSILITNQPVVARGLCSIETITEIHKRLQTLLGDKNTYLDEILFCPHHPDKGYPEENQEYKIDCECRKPKIGMLKTAASRYNIDLTKSWFIGDTSVDIMTGKNADMKTILIMTGESGKDGKYNVSPDYTVNNLLEAVNLILGE